MKTLRRPPSKNVRWIIDNNIIPANGNALDIGSGSGCDAIYLAEKGFNVDAIDPLVIASRYGEHKNINFQNSKIETFVPSVDKRYVLINAQLVFHNVKKNMLPVVISKIKNWLDYEGCFAGLFFGHEDGWASEPKLGSFFTEEEVRALLKDFKVLKFEETKWTGRAYSGDTKFWHTFDFVAEK